MQEEQEREQEERELEEAFRPTLLPLPQSPHIVFVKCLVRGDSAVHAGVLVGAMSGPDTHVTAFLGCSPDPLPAAAHDVALMFSKPGSVLLVSAFRHSAAA